MSKRNRKKAQIGMEKPPLPQQAHRRLSPGKLISGLVIAVILAGGALLLVGRGVPSGQVITATPGQYRIGNVEDCGNASPFALAMGFYQGGALDTRVKYVKGVVLRELDGDGNIARSYEHPSWSKAGYLGSYQRDQAGNIYLIPMPFISVFDNPPQKANMIYQIDGNTGAMAPLINLPSFAPITSGNVYGLLDIAYDCDTRSLYVSSVSGSTYDNAVGCIFRVDPRTKEIKSTLEGIDAFGIGVFNSTEGKRLYFGLAREPEIYSVALDQNGDFNGDIRPEISLYGLGYHGDERARSITFQGEERLYIKTLQFDFNLIAPTETQQTILEYSYSPQQNTWALLASQFTNE